MSFEQGHSTTMRRRSLLSAIALPLIAFVAGILAMAWLLSRWDAAAAFLGIGPATVVQAAPAALPAMRAPAPPIAVAPAAETQRLVLDPETMRRVTQVEQRLTEIENQSRAATGNANRAEGLLVAFAARRALDRGVPLGYLEGLLRQRFGDTQRQAVATVITAARQPVTLEELQDGLQQASPMLTGGGPDQDWWSALTSELRGLVTVRRAGAPSTIPAERLRRATRRLEAGQVDIALAEVLRMPGRGNAGEWIEDARRYVAARRALDAIETAALLEPRMPQPIAATASAAPRPAGRS